MSPSVVIAAADPLHSAALAAQLREAGYECAEAAEAGACQQYLDAAPSSILLCDADDFPGAERLRPAAALYLSRDAASCPAPALAKPVRRAELMAGLARLADAAAVLPLNAEWRLHPAARRLEHANGGALSLTEKEAALLACLLQAPSREAARAALLQEVWGYQNGIDTHTLETHLYRLRAKLKEHLGAEWLLATPAGYRIAL